MFNIKCLTRKFGRQTLSEVKPAPLSETVDHTADSSKSSEVLAPDTSFSSVSTSTNPLSTNPLSTNPPSSTPSSDSEDENEEDDATHRTHFPPLSPCHKGRRNQLRITRIPSAEKRKYSQYKCSTGSSSSASSSDDEIKEAFESYKQRLVPLSAAVPSWNSKDMWGPVYPKTMDPISSRPLRVVPSGHRKPKFFAQMSATPSERPYLDFNKMQHSKRVLMVRRPIVIRHNSKVHAMHRLPLNVSVDISKHGFQPVLTQT